ncbi:MAG: glutamine synthetase III [Candidatus Kapaibacterium sp.]
MSMRVGSIQSINTNKNDERFTNHVPDETLISNYYGKYVFGAEEMKKYLRKETLKKFEEAVETGIAIEDEVADKIAEGIKRWALDNGATHYTHWFQPLTGKTAEKHDAFFTVHPDGTALEKFDGRSLIQQEPDGSSFPTGGLRQTHTARGYTVWDPSSPVFIRETKSNKVLCIPSIFVSYRGDSLDLKTPLLRSIRALDEAATDICRYFDEEVSSVTATLGWEQEYFVVDERLYNARPDLVLCGRTLIGNASARGQQLDDHYFATIPERVNDFMQDFENECLKLGIPIKTRHNEVAPNQYECAPHFEYANISADHNQLLMDMIDRIARRHRLRVLLHEKPFAGINGSGKHSNWSMADNRGRNLLEPGDNPSENLPFLTFFINFLKAVDDNAILLRASISNTGNDHRLGAHEAPPAIISISTGDNLAIVLDNFLNDKKDTVENTSIDIRLGVSRVPAISKDSTDRNRTSPLPFTGNKFEFRAVGSSVNVSTPVTMLNLIMADRLKKFKSEVDDHINSGKDKEAAIKEVLAAYLQESGRIIFNGDNYSQEWIEEAAKRGLPNISSTPEALKVFLDDNTKTLFKGCRVLNERELEARYHVQIEEYINKLEIESSLLAEIINTYVIPATTSYMNKLINNVKGLNEIGLDSGTRSIKARIANISGKLDKLYDFIDEMTGARKEALNAGKREETAAIFHDRVKPLFEKIRENADELELLIDDKIWPLPKYRELLFIH